MHTGTTFRGGCCPSGVSSKSLETSLSLSPCFKEEEKAACLIGFSDRDFYDCNMRVMSHVQGMIQQYERLMSTKG